MPEKQPIVFGRNILNYRKLKNMSLDVLSKRSGVSKSMLSQIEQEKNESHRRHALENCPRA